MEEQIELLKLIGTELKSRTECFIIGGSAMMFYGIKNATKDIDMAFFSEAERKRVADILEKAGFYKKHFRDKDILLFERNSARLDMFLKKVMKFEVSPAMAERKREVHEFGNLMAMIASPEDIVLLKCATDREGDRLDAKNIIERLGINWGVLMEEMKWQNKNSGRLLSLFLYDFLLELRDLKASIPNDVIKELRAINRDEIGKLK